MKKQKKVIKRRTPYLALLIFFSLLIGKSLPAHSQQITSDEAPQCFMTGTKGQPLTPKSLNADVEVSGWYPMPGESINIDGINLDNPTGEISGTPTELGIDSTRIGAYDNENNLIDDAVIKIGVFADRPPADIMLVLDKSGSMAQSVPEGSLTKYSVLDSSVRFFLKKYRKWGVIDDRIGVVYFDDTRNDFIKDGGAGLHKFTDCPPPIPLKGSGSIKEDMGAKSPSGFTALGGGIFAAANEFSNEVEERNIIVFSDGIQNREPSYDMMGSKVITDHNEYPDGTGWPSGSLDLSSPPRQMKIHTLAIGGNALSSLMQDIATVGPNSGSHLHLNTTADLHSELDNLFDQAFVSALSGFSPAIVDKRRTTLSDIIIERHSAETFTVNNTADKILIKAVGNPRDMDGLKMNIRKDGKSFSDKIEYSGSHIRFFANEIEVESRGASMGGDWQVSFSGRRGISFTTTCMVNDEYVDYSTSVGGKTAPGEPLNLNLEVNLAGKPASNLTQSRAFVL
ncbi:MAG: VWA domain-containing protein, partial [Bacteroidales bacterium]|nr:VWA domain-containing protein [Bacteroidales bacterium]